MDHFTMWIKCPVPQYSTVHTWSILDRDTQYLYLKLHLYIVDVCLYLYWGQIVYIYIYICWQIPLLYDLWNINKWMNEYIFWVDRYKCLCSFVGFIKNCATQEALCDISVLSCCVLKLKPKDMNCTVFFSSLKFFYLN